MAIAKEIVLQMTTEEKISLCEGADFWHTKGIERLGIPELLMCDGPHGLRKQKGVGDHLGINESIQTVCYPSASALACSFDTKVMQELGRALGKECQSEGVAMLLGPGMNMKRSPLCGRNFEYFSEDPYLAGKMGAAYIKSLQNEGVAACCKHFAANNQETCRMSSSSEMDERTLHEIYLPAFEEAVREGKTRSVMSAYNALNGEFCSTNRELLTDILRDTFGFEGFVVTDWGAHKDGKKGMEAGIDLNMPGGRDAAIVQVKKAIENGTLSIEVLDRMAERIVQFALDYLANKREEDIDRAKCAELSEKLSTECAVLLKNDGILPLSKEKKAVFIGEFAEKPRYQGSGSSHINVEKVISSVEAAKEFSVDYCCGYNVDSCIPDKELEAEAIQAAKKADVAVVFAGLPDSFESEGFDRETLSIPENQNKLISAIAKVNPNTVVVLHGGAPMLLPWLSEVKAVLCMYLGGQNVGAASVKLLYGDVNPSGKLAESWPLKLSDTPAFLNFPGVDGVVNYAEGIFIGYRYYDKKEMEVLFPFGYGLSYTNFEYSDLFISKEKIRDTENVTVSCKVKNVGNVAGKEVLQLYISDLESEVPRPVRELKGFKKVSLMPGEEKTVTFSLDFRSFAYYESRMHDWYVESGIFEIAIGASSRDLYLSGNIEVEGTKEIPIVYTENSTISMLLKTKKGRKFAGEMMKQGIGDVFGADGASAIGAGGKKMAERMMYELPLNALTTFTEVSQEQLLDVINMLNGK